MAQQKSVSTIEVVAYSISNSGSSSDDDAFWPLDVSAIGRPPTVADLIKLLRRERAHTAPLDDVRVFKGHLDVSAVDGAVALRKHAPLEDGCDYSFLVVAPDAATTVTVTPTETKSPPPPFPDLIDKTDEISFAHVEAAVELARDHHTSGVEFTGRGDFFKAVEHVARRLVTGSFDKSRAVAFTAVSGSGKTVASLKLRDAMPTLDAMIGGELKHPPVTVAYLGFNTSMSLLGDEKRLIEHYGADAAEPVLMRRLLMATSAAVVVKERGFPFATIPSNAQLVQRAKYPKSEVCPEILAGVLGASAKAPHVLIAIVDEAQILDTNFDIRLKKETIGLGRYFMRTLRDFQETMRGVGIHLLPLATGISLNFEDGIESSDQTKVLDLDALTHLSRDEFTRLTWLRLSFAPIAASIPQGVLNAAEERERSAMIISAACWPRIRVMNDVTSADEGGTAAKPTDSSLWLEWMSRWMQRRRFTKGADTKFLPPEHREGKFQQAFIMHGDDEFEIIPDGFNANAIAGSLVEVLPFDEHLVNDKQKIAAVLELKMNLQSLLCVGHTTFEHVGFATAAMALRVGMHALTPINAPHRLHDSRLGLAAWFLVQRAVKNCALQPLILNFEGDERSAQLPFLEDERKGFDMGPSCGVALENAASQRRPIYIRSATKCRFDYAFMYPHTTDGSYIVLIVDAKHTITVEGRIKTRDQQQMYCAAKDLLNALRNVGVAVSALRLMHLTNREKVDNPQLPPSIDPEVARLIKGQGIEQLNRDTFEFEPWTGLLFAKEPRERTETAAAAASDRAEKRMRI